MPAFLININVLFPEILTKLFKNILSLAMFKKMKKILDPFLNPDLHQTVTGSILD